MLLFGGKEGKKLSNVSLWESRPASARKSWRWWWWWLEYTSSRKTQILFFSWPSEHQRLVLLCPCLSLAQSVNHALSLQITFWTAGVGTEPLLHSVNYYVLRLPMGLWKRRTLDSPENDDNNPVGENVLPCRYEMMSFPTISCLTILILCHKKKIPILRGTQQQRMIANLEGFSPLAAAHILKKKKRFCFHCCAPVITLNECFLSLDGWWS